MYRKSKDSLSLIGKLLKTGGKLPPTQWVGVGLLTASSALLFSSAVMATQLAPPILSLPTEGMTISPGTQTEFKWLGVTSANTYRLQVTSSSNFDISTDGKTCNNCVLNVKDGDETVAAKSSFTTTTPLPSGNYLWRVRAGNLDPATGLIASEWTTPRSFIVQPVPVAVTPTTPVPVTPVSTTSPNTGSTSVSVYDDCNNVTSNDIQAFLEKYNGNLKDVTLQEKYDFDANGYSLKFSPPNMPEDKALITPELRGDNARKLSPANLIYYSALENKINPVVLLAKIQQESNLVSKSVETLKADGLPKDYQETLNGATGFDITPTKPKGNPVYASFFAQLVASTFQFDKSRKEGKTFQEAYDSYTHDPKLGQQASFENFMAVYNPYVGQMNAIHPGACQSVTVTSNSTTTVATGDDKASFVRETYPDGTSVPAGTAFEKQWTLKNTGTTTWNSGYKLRYKDGSLSQKKEVPVVGTVVAPGSEYTFTVPMQAPQAQGTYTESWELVSPTGAVVKVNNSSTVWAQIQVAGNTIATNFTSGSCLMEPYVDSTDPSDKEGWHKDGNPFGVYFGDMKGYHPGEDWNYGSGEDDNGKPVYAIADGTVAKVSNLGGLGWLVAVKHTGSFSIPANSGPAATRSNGQSYSYGAETVNSLYSVYVHIKDINPKVQKGKTISQFTPIGKIMNPGGGSHLHFEIRHPDTKHSPGNWSMVGESTNWVYAINGYYLNLQQMVDAGVREPTSVIEANHCLPFVVKTVNKPTGDLQIVSTSVAQNAKTVTIDGRTVPFTPTAEGINFNTGVLQANLVTPLNIVVRDSNGKELVNTYYPFGDVPPDQLYTNAILQLWKANIVEGQNGMFEGDRNVKRSEFLKMALLATKRGTAFLQTNTSFQDVPKDYWASGYINYAQANHIAEGSNGKFRPEDSITRAETAKMIAKASSPLSSLASQISQKVFGNTCPTNLTDLEANAWYCPFVEVVSSQQVMKGQDNKFRPNDNLSRIEAAFVACRALNLNNTGLCQ